MRPKVCLTCVIQGNCSTSCEPARLQWLKDNKFGKKATKELLSDDIVSVRMNDLQSGQILDYFRWAFDYMKKEEVKMLKKTIRIESTMKKQDENGS